MSDVLAPSMVWECWPLQPNWGLFRFTKEKGLHDTVYVGIHGAPTAPTILSGYYPDVDGLNVNNEALRKYERIVWILPHLKEKSLPNR